MRTELKKINGVRSRFKGIFERNGTKKNWHGFPEPTILLKDITDQSGKVVTEHLWFTLTKGFESLGTLTPGDVVEFDARVTPYTKGYRGYRDDVDSYSSTDYRLSHPTRISRVSNQVELILA